MQKNPQTPGQFRLHRLKHVVAVGLCAFAVVAAAWYLPPATNCFHPWCGTNEEQSEPSAQIVDFPEVERKDGYDRMPARPLPVLEQGGDGKKPLPPIIDFDPPNPPPGLDKPPPAGQSAPPPKKGDPDLLNKNVPEFIEPANSLEVVQGRARMLSLKATPKRLHVAADGLITATIAGGDEISIVGNQVGTTVLNIWVISAEDKAKEVVLSYFVRVAPDPDAKGRFERAYKGLAAEIGAMFPSSNVHLKLVGDVVVISGQAIDKRDSELIGRLVAANMPEIHKAAPPKIMNVLRVVGAPGTVEEVQGMPETPFGRLSADLRRAFPESDVQLSLVGDTIIIAGAAPHRREAAQIVRVVASQTSGAANVKVLDKLQVYGAEQVVVKVVIAEVNRSVVRRGNASFDLLQRTACVERWRAANAFNVLKRMSWVRIVAEPTLMALDGQTAKFDAGGGPSMPCGVQLAFTPTILERDRIRLEVSASLTGGDSGAGKSANPRGFSSTVEINEGETLTVAGLIQSWTKAAHLPFLRIPSGEQELLILVTPELVRRPNE